MKRIAIVSDAVYPYNIGGKEKRIFEISTRLAKKGYEVTIYTMRWPGMKAEQVEHGVRLKAISPYYPLYAGERRSMKEAIMFALHCFKLVREDFDVLEADHMPHLVLFPLRIVAWVKRKKLYVTWNEVWGKKYWQKYLGTLGILAYYIERLSVLLPDEIISISEDTTKKLRSILRAQQHITTIPMGLDIEEIEAVLPAQNKSDVIYAGRLLKHKNIDVLIHTINIVRKTYKNISCLIIGNGPEKVFLQGLVNTLKLTNNVTFIDFLPDHKMLYGLMKSSKVFVFPSSREGFGIVALEANACNIPVVTIDALDNATKSLIINGENGTVVHLKDVSLAEAISSYISDTGVKNYNKYVKNNSWKVVLKEIERIYNI